MCGCESLLYCRPTPLYCWPLFGPNSQYIVEFNPLFEQTIQFV